MAWSGHRWIGEVRLRHRVRGDRALCGAIEVTIRLLLYDTFAWAYQAVFMTIVVLVLFRRRVSRHEGSDSKRRLKPVSSVTLFRSASQLDESEALDRTDDGEGSERPTKKRRYEMVAVNGGRISGVVVVVMLL